MSGRAGLRAAYESASVAEEYWERRFVSPLGLRLHLRQARAVRRLAVRARPRRVIEFAPGPARLTRDLVAAGVDSVAVDSSLAMLVHAQDRLRRAGAPASARLVRGDAFQPPLGRHFDLAVAFRFLRHFDDTDRHRLLEAFGSVLVEGGLLLFDAVNERVARRLEPPAAPGQPLIFDAPTRPERLAAELSAAGFDLVALEGVHHAYPLSRRLQILVAPRSARLARILIAAVDRCGREPLEWIVTCRRA